MLRRKLIISMLCTLFLFGLLTGCSTQNNQQSTEAQEVVSQKKDITLQYIEQEIKKAYGDQVEKVSINSNYGKDTALIEAKMKMAASSYYMYNMATGENYQLPLEFFFVKTAKIMNENYVVFDMTGGNSETSFVEPPYRLHFKKIVEDNKFAFESSKEMLRFGLSDSISFGEDINDAYVLKDLRATLDGIQFSFQTTTGEEAVFPAITTHLDEANRKFTIKAQKTQKAAVDYLTKSIAENPNIYIDYIHLEQSDNTLSIILQLNKNTSGYTAEVRDGSFVEICFSNNK